MSALNWQALVTEALRRRKAERMTQKEHAALADVSIPTIVAFDRGERTLSLSKAFDILRIVGLIEEPVAETAQDIFVRESFERWCALTATLPEASPGRFPHGWYRIDYALGGTLKAVKAGQLARILTEATRPSTGWPMFAVLDRDALAPKDSGGVLECWINPPSHAPFNGPAYRDFWRADPAGRMFLIRGYREDSQDTFPPGAIFDNTLPIWLLGEALLHADQLARVLGAHDNAIEVRLRILFTGLTGRVPRAWSKPMGQDLLLGNRASRTDEALLEVSVPAADIEPGLARHVLALAAPLYERFGVAGLSEQAIDAELTVMRRVSESAAAPARSPPAPPRPGR